MIQRDIKDYVLAMASQYPVVVISGPRQAGKTTLCQQLFPNHQYVLLEDLDTRAFAQTDPRTFLAQFEGGAIIDEAQNVPELFSYLQGIVDKERIPGRFILTGSQHFLMMEKITQSLAGRCAVIKMLPLSYPELAQSYPSTDVWHLIWHGFYPGTYQHGLDVDQWYKFYFNTYIERDVRTLRSIHNLSIFQKFVRLCAGRIGQLINMSSIASECGVTHDTVKAWLSILEACFIITMIQPHYQNFTKRLTKQPKLYFNDTGLACYLLGIDHRKVLDTHHMRGALFENYVAIEIIKHRLNQGKEPNLYFWRDHHGHEVDFILERSTQLIPIEVKASGTIASDFFTGIKYYRGLSNAKNSFVIHAGENHQKRDHCTVLNWKDITLVDKG